MLRATIHVDGRAYAGTDPDGEDERTQSPAFRNGFHDTGSRRGRDVLLFGGEPALIEGVLNLRSHVERILTRLQDGTLEARTVVIEMVQ